MSTATRYMSVSVAHRLLKNHGIEVSLKHVYNMADFGPLDKVKVGGRVFITRESLISVIEQSTGESGVNISIL